MSLSRPQLGSGSSIEEKQIKHIQHIGKFTKEHYGNPQV